MKATDSEKTRQLLLEGRSPEVQLKLAEAWEKYAEGDPESAPAIYALAQLFVMDSQVSALDRQSELLVEFREICQQERQTFEATVSKQLQSTLDGFEKRQAIFEQKQQLASESPSLEETPKKTGGLLPMALAAVIGMIGGGYAMNQYNQKQFQAEKVTVSSPAGKPSHER